MMLVNNQHVMLVRSLTRYNVYLCVINSEAYEIDRAQAERVYSASVRFAAKRISALIYKADVICEMRSDQFIARLSDETQQKMLAY